MSSFKWVRCTVSVLITFFAPWLPWQRPPFWIFFDPNSYHILRWIFLQSFMKFDEKNPNCFFKSPLFVSMATAAKFVQQIPICLAYLVSLDVDVTGNITAKLCEFNIFCTLVTMATTTILNLFNPQKLPHTTVDIPTVSWSLMKGIPIFFKSPLFCFHGNSGKVCPTDSDFFGLSRSTRCGCCSYQVSSISVWRVTCYDHFYVFHFF